MDEKEIIKQKRKILNRAYLNMIDFECFIVSDKWTTKHPQCKNRLLKAYRLFSKKMREKQESRLDMEERLLDL